MSKRWGAPTEGVSFVQGLMLADRPTLIPMKPSLKKILIMVAGAVLLLKFSTRLKNATASVPLLGPFIQ